MITIRRRDVLGDVIEPKVRVLMRPLVFSAADLALLDGVVFVPNFIEAQEAKQSDRQRQQESRARRRERARGVTNRDGESQNVTIGHDSGENVTAGHTVSQPVTPSLAVPSRAVPSNNAHPRFDFESVYALYPRKDGKAKGIAKCKAQIRTPERFAEFRLAVEHYAEKVRAEGTERRFVKQFSTFMAPDVWVDYIAQPTIDPPASKPLDLTRGSLDAMDFTESRDA